MNPYLIIACLLAVLGAGAGGFKLGVDHEVASQAREDEHVAQAIDAANHTAAEAISKIRVVNTTIQNEVQHELQTSVVYRDCLHTPDGLRLINKALAAPGAPGDSKLPGADAPK